MRSETLGLNIVITKIMIKDAKNTSPIKISSLNYINMNKLAQDIIKNIFVKHNNLIGLDK